MSGSLVSLDQQVAEVERRQQRRAPFEGWVGIAASGQHRIARGRDLSAQGIGVALEGVNYFREESVESEFALPGFFVSIALRARVAWSDAGTGKLGLCFESIEPELAELLENYVAGRL
jgi:c-di-GMP-binding flagellar brake protein YcgR